MPFALHHSQHHRACLPGNNSISYVNMHAHSNQGIVPGNNSISYVNTHAHINQGLTRRLLLFTTGSTTEHACQVKDEQSILETGIKWRSSALHQVQHHRTYLPEIFKAFALTQAHAHCTTEHTCQINVQRLHSHIHAHIAHRNRPVATCLHPLAAPQSVPAGQRQRLCHCAKAHSLQRVSSQIEVEGMRHT